MNLLDFIMDRLRRWGKRCGVAVIVLLFAVQCHGQNFTGADKVYLDRAEQCRKDLAVFWAGKELPGTWADKCDIRVKVGDVGAGGATTFNFDRGQVFGWNMTIQGTHERLMDSVIPHEVNHTIFASLVRRPITRWLDEGCATLFECPSEHKRQREMASQYMDSRYTVFRQFDAGEYPKDMDGVLALYSTGFTLVEWMLEQKGPDTLYDFVKDDRKPSVKFAVYYGASPSQAWQEWRTWLRDRPTDCEGAGCRFNSFRTAAKPVVAAVGSKPTLWVVGAPSCIHCVRFDFDFSMNSQFRRDLMSRYIVIKVNGNAYKIWAQQHGVHDYPSFVVSNSSQIVTGYPGKRDLLSALMALPVKRESVARNEGWVPVKEKTPESKREIPMEEPLVSTPFKEMPDEKEASPVSKANPQPKTTPVLPAGPVGAVSEVEADTGWKMPWGTIATIALTAVGVALPTRYVYAIKAAKVAKDLIHAKRERDNAKEQLAQGQNSHLPVVPSVPQGGEGDVQFFDIANRLYKMSQSGGMPQGDGPTVQSDGNVADAGAEEPTATEDDALILRLFREAVGHAIKGTPDGGLNKLGGPVIGRAIFDYVATRYATMKNVL